jgi:pSer/pThr/pTyr-binding forkhead associated (FHA) protein
LAGSGSIQPAAAPPHERAPSPRPDGATAAIAAVYLISDAGRRVDVPAQDVVIVGREDMRSGIRPDVDLTLDGASTAGISRRHCRLLHQPEGWYVEDLMSTNYTVLNGKPLRAHVPVRIIHGDELRLGKLRLRFYET